MSSTKTSNFLRKYHDILITGGTGSIGQAFIDRMISYNSWFQYKSITVLSRDETKQHYLKTTKYKDYKNIRWVVGDIRDYETVHRVTRGKDLIVHTAAMKHVPACEEYPEEAVKTNIQGAINIVNAVKEHNENTNSYQVVVGCSTDKACDPTTVMGLSKAMMEKIFINAGIDGFRCVRFGNILESRGSVFHTFRRQAKNKEPMTITDGSMTRFITTFSEAVDTLECAAVSDEDGLFVMESNVVSITSLAMHIWKHYNEGLNFESVKCGIRKSEKMHEALLTEEEFRHATYKTFNDKRNILHVCNKRNRYKGSLCKLTFDYVKSSGLVGSSKKTIEIIDEILNRLDKDG